jgi:predicted phage terminase large subunit-like protein
VSAPTPSWLSPQPPQPPQPVLDPEVEQVLAELARREQAMTSLARFAATYTPFVPARHHQLICEGVDALVNDDLDVLVVMSPPASAKSSYISIAAPAYIIGRDPGARIISVSRAAELAADFGGRVKGVIESSEYQRDTSTRIAYDTRAKDNWKTTEGGSYFAVGVGGGVLGKRADWVICDDIHTSFEDAQSESQLAKIHNWFESDLLSRLTPKGKLIVIGQRLNANDIIGYTLQRYAENPRVRLRVLKFTAEATSEVSPDAPDLLGRTAPGERMWPEFYTEDYLHDKKRDEFIWRTLWMQEPPSSTGDWVSPSELLHRPAPGFAALADPSRRYALYGMTDLALSINSGDYTVHFIVAINEAGEWDIVHGERARIDPDASAERVVALAAAYRPVEWLIDDDNAAKVFAPLVATRARAARVAVNWRTMPMRGQDKETRAAALRGAFKRGLVHYPADAPFARWLTTELLRFPNATGNGVDDGVDALGLMGRRMGSLSKPAATQPAAPPRKTVQDACLNDLWEQVERRGPRGGALRI